MNVKILFTFQVIFGYKSYWHWFSNLKKTSENWMNVNILFTFQVIFIYKSYWLLIFKSEKDKSYSFMGVHGMLVVPNCWDVGTWGWLERKIESLFYEWTHLYMDLEDNMVILPYKWTTSSMHLESYHHQNGFWKKKEDIGIWKWRR